MNPNQLDQSVVNMAKAIREIETGSNYGAKGKSGEFGAYQYTPLTWQKYAQEAGVKTPLEQASKEEQNQVTYYKLKQWKDQGYNVGQIASMWNSGKPDAYLDPNYKGKNKFGVAYDVPQYAKSVAEVYQKLKAGTQPTSYPKTASTVTDQNTPEQPPKDFLQKAEDVVTKIFPGQKVGQAIGGLLGYLLANKQEKPYYDLSGPTPLQTIGDVAQGALMVGAGLPEAGAASAEGKALLGGAKNIIKPAASVAGRIGQNIALGAGFGASGALSKGETDMGNIAKETAVGGATGGIVGGAAEALSGLANWLPKRFARGYIGSPASDESVQQALNRGLKSPAKMLEEAQAAKQSAGKKLEAVLSKPEYANVKINGKDLLTQVANEFPESGMTYKDVAATLKRSAPLKENLVDKLLKGKITLKELHSLNSDIGGSTFKTVFDDPAVRAGKDVGNKAYHTIGDFIKNTAKDSVEHFDNYSKEAPLVQALKLLVKRSGKARPITLRDIVAVLAGSGVAGVPGAALALGAEKALVNPTINLSTMGLLQKATRPASQIGRGLLKPLILRGANQLQ